MMACEQLLCRKAFKGIANNRPRSFLGETLSPKDRPQMKSDFIDPLLRKAWSQARTADVMQIRQQEEGPVLDSEGFHSSDFHFQFLLYLIPRERTSQISIHLRIAPKPLCQRQVIMRPATESNSSGLQKVQVPAI